MNPTYAAAVLLLAHAQYLTSQCGAEPIWSAAASNLPTSPMTCVAALDGGFYVGGIFTSFAGTAAARVVHLRQGQAHALGAGIGNGIVQAMLVRRSGALVVGGFFNGAGGALVADIAQWNGTTWSALGSGLGSGTPLDSGVSLLVELANGDLVAGGSFQTAGGVPASRLARWDGSSWAPLGAGATSVFGLAPLPNGGLVATGVFPALGATPAVATWNGVAWSRIGPVVPPVPSLARAVLGMANGDVVAAFGGSVQRWDGSQWSLLGTAGSGFPGDDAFVTSLATLPDGSLLAGGTFNQVAGTSANLLARFDLTTGAWSSFGSTTGLPFPAPSDRVHALAVGRDGDVLVSAWLPVLGGTAPLTAVPLIAVRSACSAQATSVGTGCAGSGGVNALAAIAPAWLGGDLRVVGSGLVAGSLVVGALGLPAPATPLAALLPAPAACTLDVSPLLLLASIATGSATLQQAIPATAALLGATLRAQMVGLELSGSGGIQQATRQQLRRFRAGSLLTATLANDAIRSARARRGVGCV